MQALPTVVDDDFDLDDPNGGNDDDNDDGGSDDGGNSVVDSMPVKATKRRGQPCHSVSNRIKVITTEQFEDGPLLTASVRCAAAPASRRRQKQRVSKKGSASAPVSPCSGPDPAAVLTELRNSTFSRADTAAATSPAYGVDPECIVLEGDMTSNAVEAYRSAPVSPSDTAAARNAGLSHADGIGRGKRSVDELTLVRSLFADPTRPRAPWPMAAHELPAARPPAHQAHSNFSLEDTRGGSHSFGGTVVLSPSPLPLRERLRHRVDSEQHPCEATGSIPDIDQAGSSSVCRDFGEPGIAVVGGNIWRTQDSQPSVQADAGLETHSVLGSEELHEANDCISLLTP